MRKCECGNKVYNKDAKYIKNKHCIRMYCQYCGRNLGVVKL